MPKPAVLALSLLVLLFSCSDEITLKLDRPLTATISLPGGIYHDYQSVSIASSYPGSSIYYTLDGTDPRSSAARMFYTSPFAITRSLVLKAVALVPGSSSDVTTDEYRILRVAPLEIDVTSPAHLDSLALKLSTYPAEAAISFTTDGSDPLTSPTRQTYAGGLSVENSLRLKAVATAPGYMSSASLSYPYYIFTRVTFGACEGQYRSIHSEGGILHLLTFDASYNGGEGISRLYRLSGGAWQEKTSVTGFNGSWLETEGASVYMAGPRRDGLVHFYQYDGSVTRELGEGLENVSQRVFVFDGKVFASKPSLASGCIYTFDRVENCWEVLATGNFIERAQTWEGFCYFINNGRMYWMDSAGSILPCARLGHLPINASAFLVQDGILKAVSLIGTAENALFAIDTASNILYADSLLPASLSSGEYVQLAHVDSRYHYVNTKFARIFSSSARVLSLEPAGAYFNTMFVHESKVYYVINGLFYSLEIAVPGGELS